MKKIFYLLILLSFSPLQHAFAQDLTISRQGQELRADPGGKKMAELEAGAAVKYTGLQRGKWLKVNITGWIERDSVSLFGKINKDAKKTPKAIKFLGYRTKLSNPVTLKEKQRVTVYLKVQNITKSYVKRWKGVLTVKNKAGATLYVTALTHGDAELGPGESGEVGYYWVENEKAFGVFVDNKPSELDFRLSKVKINY